MRMEIVGVVADAVYFSLRETVHPTVYTPLGQFYFSPAVLPSMSLNVRSTAPSPAALTKSVADAIQSVNPHLAFTFQSLSDQVGASLTQERLIAMLAASFGGLALLLAGLGLYGVTSYAVSIRLPEIGIRMALGAAPARVVRLVLGRIAVLIGLGVIAGGGASLWLSPLVASLLYGLEPRDPLTLAGAIATLTAVGALAGWLPARRASRIDPAIVLRCE
jgi:ABC-type antimicrobial peptide transport system permease subunit